METHHQTAIRPLRLSDKSWIAPLINNKKVIDNLRDGVPHPYSEDDAVFFSQYDAEGGISS